MSFSDSMIYILTAADLTNCSGDSVRIAALSSGLSKQANSNVSLVYPYHMGNMRPAILDEFDTEKLNLVPLNVNNSISSRNGIIESLIAIRRFLRNIDKKDIVQVETSNVAGILASLGFSNYVLDVHGIYSEELVHNHPNRLINIPYKRFMKGIEGKGLKEARITLTASEFMKNFLINTYEIENKRVFTVYNGFAKNLVDSQKKVEEFGNITFIGALTKWANVKKIIKAAKALKNYDLHFYIVGGGAEKPGIEHLIKKYELQNVTLTGRLPFKETYSFIAKSQILVCPLPKSFALEVACPIKLLEYMAFGKAILVDRVGEIPDKLEKNDAALVSDPMNDEDFVKKLSLLVEDKNLRIRISQNAKKLAEDYTWEHQIDKLVQIYKLL
jgi:glycosyltransferase involved in cell wall biosynthesis